MNIPRPLVIATRGSQLALWQARHVQSLFADKQIVGELKIVKTKGDRIQDRFLHEIGGKGVFVREIEDVLKRGEADVAIHSLKDLPAAVPSGFALPAILPRHSHRDLMIFAPQHHEKNGEQVLTREEFAALGALKIATGSLRRSCLLQQASPSCQIEGLRGNVDTRLNKLSKGEWDAIVLADASLERLGWLDRYPSRPLDPSWFVPSPSQGALALETTDDFAYKSAIQNWNCSEANFAVACERSLLGKLGGDCTMPIGVYVRKESDSWFGDAIVLNHDSECSLAKVRLPESVTQEELVRAMLMQLVESNVDHVLSKLGLKRP